MIVIGKLSWSFAFSYGENNEIDFSKASLTQLIGKNGFGKSSIALILEEGLYNKNSKGVKKSDIINRYLDAKAYTICVQFWKGEDEYEVFTTRSSSSSVTLFKNGEDISAHTATNTYKMIEDIIGLDHKAFAQIVYQSSASSLEFLTATDSNRKKFLIDLWSLEEYSQKHEHFKEILKAVEKEISGLEGVLSVANSWLAKLKNQNLQKNEMLPLPSYDVNSMRTKISDLSHKLQNIETLNKAITQNNKYKELQAAIIVPTKTEPIAKWDHLLEERAAANAIISATTQFITKNKALHVANCPTCSQKINVDEIKILTAEKQAEKDKAQADVTRITAEISKLELAKKAYDKAVSLQNEWERYHLAIDKTMQSELHDASSINTEIAAVRAELKDAETHIASVEATNMLSRENNAKIDVILSQKEDMTSQATDATAKLLTLQRRQGRLSILVKSFSSTGVVAYKIESLVKDLEDLTNKYLQDLSDGRFTLEFRISASDKLNVIITDNGNEIDILALSGGERARVNMATLLAIRRLMQSISNSRLNLLILDEVVEALDVDGKDKLIETLLAETELNTVLVSHSFTHPLLEKVHVVKENNISRIEHG